MALARAIGGGLAKAGGIGGLAIAGVAGAPKLGDAVAWEPRIAKGMDTLYNSVINGLPPAMPAKGMCFSCSDDDLRALVDYMVDSLK